MLANDGRCKTLDASADGYVRAEDCVILVLEEATAQTDSHVLLSGTGVNQVHSHHTQVTDSFLNVLTSDSCACVWSPIHACEMLWLKQGNLKQLANLLA